MFDGSGIEKLIGAKIYDMKISEDQSQLMVETNRGDFVYGVEGDCCSHSYFSEIVGLDKAKENGAVVSAKELDIIPADLVPKGDVYEEDYETIKVYGFEIVTTNPRFGEQTTVLTFRNSSNGYYGGWMELRNNPIIEGNTVAGMLE